MSFSTSSTCAGTCGAAWLSTRNSAQDVKKEKKDCVGRNVRGESLSRREIVQLLKVPGMA